MASLWHLDRDWVSATDVARENSGRSASGSVDPITPREGRGLPSFPLCAAGPDGAREPRLPGFEPPGAQGGVASQTPHTLGSGATGAQPGDGPTVEDGRRRFSADAPHTTRESPAPTVASIRREWARDGATCHFCRGPAFAWLTDDEEWAKVAPLLGQHQACFECYAAARVALGLDDGEPLRVSTVSVERASQPAYLLDRVAFWWGGFPQA